MEKKKAEKKKAHFIEMEDGRLKLVLPENKSYRKPKFNSMPFVMRAMRAALVPEREYHALEIIELVNQCSAGQMLSPSFVGKNAQKLLDTLVRNEKMLKLDGEHYALPPERI